MGRKLVEATNACRIRRTRGDMGRLRLLRMAGRALAVADFGFPVAAALLLVVFLVGIEGCFGLDDLVLADLLWLDAECVSGGVLGCCFGESTLEDCGGNAHKRERDV